MRKMRDKERREEEKKEGKRKEKTKSEFIESYFRKNLHAQTCEGFLLRKLRVLASSWFFLFRRHYSYAERRCMCID